MCCRLRRRKDDEVFLPIRKAGDLVLKPMQLLTLVVKGPGFLFVIYKIVSFDSHILSSHHCRLGKREGSQPLDSALRLDNIA